jgi:hypothetical protein
MNEREMLRKLVHYYSENATINSGCTNLSKKLDRKWGGKYIYHVYSGKSKPSQKLKRAITNLYQKEYHRYPRHRLYIQAESKEEKARWLRLSMKKRRMYLNKGCDEERI